MSAAGGRPLGLTIHVRVKNEERFVRAALASVLPLADHVMVYDTGSTDRTLEEIHAIRSPKIELVRVASLSPSGLAGLRNHMVERTRTEWFMLVDGDEIYASDATRRLAAFLPTVPARVHRVLVRRRHFVGSFNVISREDALGRIYRTRQIRFGIASVGVQDRVGHETPYLKDAPMTPWSAYSMTCPAGIEFLHCQYLERSSAPA